MPARTGDLLAAATGAEGVATGALRRVSLRALRVSDAVADRRVRNRGGRMTNYTIGVLTKTLDLLDVLDAHRTLSLTELSGRAGVNKITAYRILANLEQRGYVERDAVTGEYRLGVRLMQLGAHMSEGLDLRRVARPILETLRVEFDETVNLAVPKDNGIVYIDILE